MQLIPNDDRTKTLIASTDKGRAFESPILSKFAPDGTLKLPAYLTLLYDPDPTQLVGMEEPENQLHPRLLPELAQVITQPVYQQLLLQAI